MKKFPIVLDLETKHTFREFDEPKKLGISVVAIYDYKDEQSKIFEEDELPKLFPLLEGCSYVVGFNSNSFDLQVLQAYYPGKVENLSSFDILDDIKEKLGKRLSLNDILSATLNKKKTGHGLMAIDYYKEGRWDELKRYCLDDTMLTKEIFEYGARHGEINYLNSRGKSTIKVSWQKYLEGNGRNTDVPLTLPF